MVRQINNLELLAVPVAPKPIIGCVLPRTMLFVPTQHRTAARGCGNPPPDQFAEGANLPRWQPSEVAPSPLSLFLIGVNVKVTQSGCWEWDGCRHSQGYGLIKAGTYVHRRSWEIANGFVPKGLKVLHRCDNPACFRPSHLFLGTQKDNIQDCIQKGRHISCRTNARGLNGRFSHVG